MPTHWPASIWPWGTASSAARTVSAQYAGGLFELSVALVGDAVFHALWQASGLSADELWPRHANLE